MEVQLNNSNSTNMNSTNAKSSGIGMTGALFLIFLVLKLTNLIDWSWWWVFTPLWMPLALIAAGFLLFLVIAKIWG